MAQRVSSIPQKIVKESLKTEEAGSSSESAVVDPRSATLDKLEQELRSYVPRDHLDEDEMITLIGQMNDEDKQRQLTKEQLMQLDRTREVSPPSPHSHSQWYEQFERIVDSEFFDFIVDNVTDKYYSKGDGGPAMDDRELDELRQRLGIPTYGHGKRNRKRKSLDHSSDDFVTEGDWDAKESSSTRAKAYRRVTRNSTMKRIQEHQRQADLERMDTLLEAMFEVEKLSPLRKKYINGENKTKTKRGINLNREYMKLKGTKRNRDTDHDTTDAASIKEDVCIRNTNQESLGLNGKRLKASKGMRPVIQAESTTSSEPKDKPLISGYGIDCGTNSFILNKRAESIPTPRFLDWKRRQQNVDSEAAIPPQNPPSNKSFTVKPISTHSTIPLPTLQGFDATIRSDPPRYRHPDITYGTWCSQLIKYLNGPGRLFARYEFFYSDIDRAWFNHNSFQADVVKLGFSPDIQLSRAEWSYVRRRMKNKPRRFSNHFVRLQMKSLENYRNIVRNIQRSPNDSSMIPADFGYEVLNPITIGSTVTAFNKRTKLLHRGVVLSKGPNYSNSFLIQFERKELGFEFCLDVDIASHGVKEVLIPANAPVLYGSHFSMNSAKFGGLAYGSTYGTILNFNKGFTKETLRKFYNRKGNDRVVTDQDKATEKEILVKLMFMMDSSLKRKARILKTIEKFNRIIISCEKRSNESASKLLSRPCNTSFREDYIWLKNSLVSTNHAIKTCLCYLQIMYGPAYSSGIQDSSQADPRLHHQNHAHVNNKAGGMAWKKRLKTGSSECGRIICNTAQKSKSHENGSGSSHASTSLRDETTLASHESYLKGLLSEAASLLFSTEISRKSISECGGDKIISGLMTQSIFSDARNSLQPATLKTNIPVNLAHVVRARDVGFQALSEALHMLEGELNVLTEI